MKETIIEKFAFFESVLHSKKYLDQFYLSDIVYKEKIENHIKTIYNTNNQLIFKEIRGGLLFTEDDFISFKSFLKDISYSGDFYIIEDNANLEEMLKFQYHSTLNWEEINWAFNSILNEGISYNLFQNYSTNYFVFGESKEWGLYIEIDSLTPKRKIVYHLNIEIPVLKFIEDLTSNFSDSADL